MTEFLQMAAISPKYWSPVPEARQNRAIKRSRLFAISVFLAMLVSSVVIVEPAPVDVLVIGLLLFGSLAGFLEFSSIAPIALVPLAGFVIANITSMYDPLDFTHAAWYVLVTIYLTLSWIFFVAFFTRYGAGGVRLVFLGYTLSALFCVTLGLLSYFHVIGFETYLLRFGRPKGVFKDPNVFGPYLVPIVLFALNGLIFKRKNLLTNIATGFIASFLSIGVLVSYSRAAWINYIVSVALYFVLAILLRPTGAPLPFSVAKASLCLVLGIFGIALGLQIPAVQAMMAQRVTSNGLQNYDRDRFRTHDLAVQSAVERPLGIGPGQAEEAFQYATHSSYMRALSENGYFGLTCYGAFIIICFGMAIRRASRTEDPFWKKVYLIAAACIVGHAINSAVVDTIHWRHYWLILALPWPSAAPATTSGVLRRVGREMSTRVAMGVNWIGQRSLPAQDKPSGNILTITKEI